MNDSHIGGITHEFDVCRNRLNLAFADCTTPEGFVQIPYYKLDILNIHGSSFPTNGPILAEVCPQFVLLILL